MSWLTIRLLSRRVRDSVPRRRILREIVFGANDSFSSPGFADGQVSMVFSFDKACHAGGNWSPATERPCARVIGPMTAVGPTALGERLEAIGVYFRAAQAQQFTSVPGSELTDRNINLVDLWGHAAPDLLMCLHESAGEPVNWAQAALELGYADQSHMIAEYRRFSSLTPEMLASRRWFHPFIERARRFNSPCAQSISPARTAADNRGRRPLSPYPTY